MEAKWLCELTQLPVEPATCLSCNSPDCFLTPSLVLALEEVLEEDDTLALLKATGVRVLRVSDLVGCPRRGWYRVRGMVQLETPSRLWARFRGALFHRALTLSGNGAMVEKRLVVNLQRWGADVWLTGKIDGYSPSHATLWDYKTMTWLGSQLSLPLPQHVEQLHFYAFLLQQNNYPVEHIYIIYLTMDRALKVEVPIPEMEEIPARAITKTRQIYCSEKPCGPLWEWECKYCSYWQYCK